MEVIKQQQTNVIIKKISTLNLDKLKIVTILIDICEKTSFEECQKVITFFEQIKTNPGLLENLENKNNELEKKCNELKKTIEILENQKIEAVKKEVILNKKINNGPVNEDGEINKPFEENENNSWQQWYEIAKYYRIKKDFKNAYSCIKKSYKKNIPEESLFKFFEELALSSFYLNKINIGFEAYERFILCSESGIHWSWKDNALKNQSYYMKKIDFNSVVEITCKDDLNYLPSSSAIIPFENYYFINVRTVNYSIDLNGKYLIRDYNSYVKTINRFAKVNDEQLTTENQFIIFKKVEDYSPTPKFNVNIQGMEDLRLFNIKKIINHDQIPDLKIDVFVIYPQINESRTPQVCYGVMNAKAEIRELYPLTVKEELQCEKNWLPFINENDEICFIYSFSPFQVYKIVFKEVIEYNGITKDIVENNNGIKEFINENNIKCIINKDGIISREEKKKEVLSKKDASKEEKKKEVLNKQVLNKKDASEEEKKKEVSSKKDTSKEEKLSSNEISNNNDDDEVNINNYIIKKVGVCKKIFEKTYEKDISSFRGSSPPVLYNDGWLMVIHQVLYNNNQKRKYFHRFVWISTDYESMRYSVPFFIESPNIEYTLGLCKKHNSTSFYFLYSVNDNCSKVAELEAKTIESCFESKECLSKDFDNFLKTLENNN